MNTTIKIQPSPIAAAVASVLAQPWVRQTADAADQAEDSDQLATIELTGQACPDESARKKAQVELCRVIGSRLREAREMCGLQLTTAALRLGYRNGSKLSKIENATDGGSVPVLTLYRAAMLYEVATDYLFGASDDWEVGPQKRQERAVSRWLFSAWEQARARDMGELVRLHDRLDLLSAEIPRLQAQAESAKVALARFAELNPEFEDMRGGARLAAAVDATAELTRDTSRRLLRLRSELSGTQAAPIATTQEYPA
jgi:transcriptional regulator with XRE-family HTH domain